MNCPLLNESTTILILDSFREIEKQASKFTESSFLNVNNFWSFWVLAKQDTWHHLGILEYTNQQFVIIVWHFTDQATLKITVRCSLRHDLLLRVRLHVTSLCVCICLNVPVLSQFFIPGWGGSPAAAQLQSAQVGGAEETRGRAPPRGQWVKNLSLVQMVAYKLFSQDNLWVCV